MAAPAIRAPQRDDLAAITALVRACDVAEYRRPDFSEADLRWEWGWPRFELGRDAWVAATPDGALIGYGWVWERKPGAEFDGRIFLHPGCDSSDAGEALLSLMEARVQVTSNELRGEGADPAAASLPPGPAAMVSRPPPDLAIPCASVDRLKRGLLAARGFAMARSYFCMEIDLSSGSARPRWPEGFEVRPIRRGPDDAMVYETLQDAFADHYRFTPEPRDEWTHRVLDHDDFAPQLSLLVRHRDRPVAAMTNYLLPDLGWVGMLGVRRPWRGRGLATASLLQSFEAFRAAGRDRVGLGVDADNADGAVKLYERAGMGATQRHDLLVKRFPFSSASR
jgi:GNAT superfamily N-acetyltransferase